VRGRAAAVGVGAEKREKKYRKSIRERRTFCALHWSLEVIFLKPAAASGA